MSAHPKQAAISSIYAAVSAPAWASPNLDGLADVLRDLSWLPEGPVTVDWSPPPDLDAADRLAIERVLRRAVEQSAGTMHPVEWRIPG